jgi:hypothetical protein
MMEKKGKQSANRSFFILMGILILCVMIFAVVKMVLQWQGPVPAAGPENVRQPHVAGQFYPAQQGTLQIMVDSFLNNAEDKRIGDVKALIVPHAGYIYSAGVAGEGFKQLESKKDKIKKVFIIGNNHVNGAWFDGISVTNYTHFGTPLGKVKVSPIATELLGKKPFTYNALSENSHIIEVELPFLQRMLGEDFEIIPLVVGSANQDVINDAAKEINNYIDDSSIIVISSDLSHYHPYADAVQLDTSCIAQIENQSFSGASSCEACGIDAILILLRISEMRGWKAKIVDYKNSGDTAGDKSAVVGYSAIAFYTEPGQFKAEVVNAEEQKVLLKLARDTVELYVKEKKTPDAASLQLTPTMKEVRGCFVTLNENGGLRGCIGHIVPQKPLYECVIENAVNAATADPRFPAVQPAELGNIEIEISILTLPEELSYSSPDDLLSKLRPNIDGVVLQSGFRSSTFLPQVWEMFESKESFMQALCQKQGSPDDCWKSAKVAVYQAQVFGEV